MSVRSLGHFRRRGLITAAFSPRRLRPYLAGWWDSARSPVTLGQGMATLLAAASTQYHSIADNASLSTGDIDWSLWGWFYSTVAAGAAPGTYWAVAKDAGGINREHWLRHRRDDDSFRFAVSKDGTAVTEQIASTFGAVPRNTWFFAIGWHDSVLNTINIQVNDGVVDSTAYADGVFDSTAAFTIGAGNGVGSNTWEGRIQAVGFIKAVLTAAQRTALYNGGVPLPADRLAGAGIPTPVSYWNGQQAANSTMIDQIGSNNLAAVNAPGTTGGAIVNAVSQRNDLSGYARHAAQATQARKPTIVQALLNGKPADLYGGTDDVLTHSAINLGTAHTLVVVYRPYAAATGVVLGNAAGEYGLRVDGTNLRYKPAATVAEVLVAHGGLSVGTAYIIEVVRNGTSADFYVNGTQKGTTQTLGSNDALTLSSIGAYSDATIPTTAYIPSIEEVSRVLTAAERARNRRWLSREWGIAVA